MLKNLNFDPIWTGTKLIIIKKSGIFEVRRHNLLNLVFTSEKQFDFPKLKFEKRVESKKLEKIESERKPWFRCSC